VEDETVFVKTGLDSVVLEAFKVSWVIEVLNERLNVAFPIAGAVDRLSEGRIQVLLHALDVLGSKNLDYLKKDCRHLVLQEEFALPCQKAPELDFDEALLVAAVFHVSVHASELILDVGRSRAHGVSPV
jgi:hypothetical protein